MKHSKFTEAQIIGILNEQGNGQKVSEICRKHGISEATFHGWKKKYGGLSVDELKRLKDVEAENARLRPGEVLKGYLFDRLGLYDWYEN